MGLKRKVSRTATMVMFLLSVFALYGGIHVYLYQKVRDAITLDPPWNVASALILLFLCFAPFLIHISEIYGLEVLARSLSYAGYLWMGFLFLFFSTSLLVDLYRLTVTAGGYILGTDIGRLLP